MADPTFLGGLVLEPKEGLYDQMDNMLLVNVESRWDD